MDIKQEKRSIRNQIREIKKTYSLENKKELSKSIWTKLEQESYFINSDIILLYWSMDDEVFTHDFILKWYKDKTILLPCVEGDDLKLRVFKGMDSMKEGDSFSILEPIGEEFTNYETIDLMIIPGIAFDKENNRLGRGRGFYDRLLSIKNDKEQLRIGVGFSFQKIERVPTESFDQRLDLVLISE